MIRQIPYEDAVGDVVPQAIFWRPVRYLSSAVVRSSDDLDDYIGVSFAMGNSWRFAIRCYVGHPQETSTLYLELGVDPLDIDHYIQRAIDTFLLPKFAVAWRRGEEFAYGVLNRRGEDRLREPEARLLALKIASLLPDHRATTEQLIENALEFFSPSEIDLQPSRTRPTQPQWHQIVRNVISHRTGTQSLFAAGLANRTHNGLVVTDLGMDRLRRIGFVP